jgi:hypothetical protein
LTLSSIVYPETKSKSYFHFLQTIFNANPVPLPVSERSAKLPFALAIFLLWHNIPYYATLRCVSSRAGGPLPVPPLLLAAHIPAGAHAGVLAALFFPRKIKAPASDVNHYVLDPAAVAGKPEVLSHA